MDKSDKKILKLLWEETEKIKQHPDFMPHHKFAKEFAIGWIVLNIISKIEGKYSVEEINEFYKKERIIKDDKTIKKTLLDSKLR